MSRLHERNETIAMTHALIVARIARSDYPDYWPALFEELSALMSDTANELVQLRAAGVLSCTVKALCSHDTAARGWRGGSAVALFQLASQMLTVCGDAVLLAIEQQETVADGRVVQLYAYGSKIVRRLLSFAASDVQSLAAVTIERELQRIARIGALIPELRDDSRAASHDTALYILVLQLKMIEQSFARSTVEEALIVAAAPYVPACFALLAVCDPSSEDTVPMVALKLLSSVLKDIEVRDAPPMAPYWSATTLCPLIELLLERYFVLRDSELNDWAADGEAFFLEQDLDLWQATPRARAKGFALDCVQLVGDLPALVAGTLTRRIVLAESMRGAEATRLDGARLLDACYALCGVAAFELHEHIDFAGWLNERLAPELAAVVEQHEPAHCTDQFAPLMQRRVLWLLTAWVNDVPASVRPQLCRLLASVVGAEHADLVVRLTAVSTLHTFVVDSITSRDAFLPVMRNVRDSIVALVRRVRELETKRGLLEFLGSIVSRYGPVMQDDELATIVTLLGQLWDDAVPPAQRLLRRSGSFDFSQFNNNDDDRRGTADQLLRNEILGVMNNMILALSSGRRSVAPLYDTVAPLVRYALDEADKGDDLLLEHALPLWEATVAAMTIDEAATPVVQLYGLLVNRMACSTEHLDLTTRLLTAYWRAPTTLASDQFASDAAAPTARLVATLLGDVRDDGLVMLAEMIDVFMQRCMLSEATTAHCEPVLVRALALLFSSGESAEAKRTYALMWARALINRPQWTHALLGAQQPLAPMSLLGAILDALLDDADHWSTRQSKTVALAASAALGLGDSAALERALLIVNACVEATFDLTHQPFNEFDVEGAEGNSTLWLFAVDPVNTQQPAQALHQVLRRLQAERPVEFEAVLANVDAVVMQQFEQLISTNKQ